MALWMFLLWISFYSPFLFWVVWRFHIPIEYHLAKCGSNVAYINVMSVDGLIQEFKMGHSALPHTLILVFGCANTLSNPPQSYHNAVSIRTRHAYQLVNTPECRLIYQHVTPYLRVTVDRLAHPTNFLVPLCCSPALVTVLISGAVGQLLL